MKIKVFNSILSCTLKSIRFLSSMINKKIILGLFVIGLLGACTSPTAMLGPVYTLSSTGSALNAGFSYGSSELITMYTGKTPIENIQKIAEVEENNIHKKTLESEDFYILVKNKIETTGSSLKLFNQ